MRAESEPDWGVTISESGAGVDDIKDGGEARETELCHLFPETTNQNTAFPMKCDLNQPRLLPGPAANRAVHKASALRLAVSPTSRHSVVVALHDVLSRAKLGRCHPRKDRQ